MAIYSKFEMFGEKISLFSMGGALEIGLTASQYRRLGKEKAVAVLDWYEQHEREISAVLIFEEGHYSEQFVSQEELSLIINGEIASDHCKQQAREVLEEKKEEERKKEERKEKERIKREREQMGKQVKDGKGFIYLIRNSANLYKIGFSKEPEKRLAQLQTSHAERLDMIGCRYDHRASFLEKGLHKCYADKHVRGEWFALAETDIETILNPGEPA